MSIIASPLAQRRHTRAAMNEPDSVEFTAATPNLLNAIGLLAIQFPEKFHIEAWRALTAEISKREIGLPAGLIILTQRHYDGLPSDVRPCYVD